MSYADFQLDTRSFDGTLKKLAAVSTRTDYEIVTMNAGDVLRSIAYNSPKRTGNMNKGWQPAWNALGIPGTPNTRTRAGNRSNRRYVPQGSFVDGRKAAGEKFFEFTNESHYLKPNGTRYRYPVVVATRTGFMRKAEQEAARKLEKRLQQQYAKMMRGQG